jgi:hypothetical protein
MLFAELWKRFSPHSPVYAGEGEDEYNYGLDDQVIGKLEARGPRTYAKQ